MRNGSCLPWCTTYNSCKARRLEASGKARNGRLSPNPAIASPKQARPWSGPMIILRSNNPASERLALARALATACAGFFYSLVRRVS